MTNEQINDMKHAIGYDSNQVKRGKYDAYRNFFNTGIDKDESWELLVENGYAIQSTCFGQNIYRVTRKGIDFLESILSVKIIEKD
jgi:hypothetical protein